MSAGMSQKLKKPRNVLREKSDWNKPDSTVKLFLTANMCIVRSQWCSHFGHSVVVPIKRDEQWSRMNVISDLMELGVRDPAMAILWHRDHSKNWMEALKGYRTWNVNCNLSTFVCRLDTKIDDCSRWPVRRTASAWQETDKRRRASVIPRCIGRDGSAIEWT